ncbi:MAG TPA: tRNA (adenosine(37)-N6)-threonylcarbamoyltransferase complex transferase subunit TsaD [Opitutaceae bacterium]|jgi:N6-L-threonylcarbamoyladenine synthase
MILAVESSCDESALALFDPARGLAGEWIHSQIALHEQHGGVVPDLAAREHLRHLAPLVVRAAAAGGISRGGARGPHARSDVDSGTAGFSAPGYSASGSLASLVTSIAVTFGPGLAPCLALGVAAAKALALAWNKPLLGVNHLRGHVWSTFIPLHASDPTMFATRAEKLFPHLALLVSGGHTLLAEVGADRSVTIISSTRDDAAGEALDKGAKLLALGYPGGPLIEQRSRGGRADAFDFPRGLDRKSELDFSFSGLKTSLRYTLEKMPDAADRVSDLCASYQEAVVDALATKTRRALAAGAYRSVGLSGGVARNGPLRARIAEEARRARAEFLPVDPEHSGDNAGMIAFAAWMDPGAVNREGWGLGIEPSLGL